MLKKYDKEALKLTHLNNLLPDIKVNYEKQRRKYYNMKGECKRLKEEQENLKFEFAMNDNILLNEDYKNTRNSFNSYRRSIRIYKALYCEDGTE